MATAMVRRVAVWVASELRGESRYDLSFFFAGEVAEELPG
jgi:hypothetical protein